MPCSRPQGPFLWPSPSGFLSHGLRSVILSPMTDRLENNLEGGKFILSRGCRGFTPSNSAVCGEVEYPSPCGVAALLASLWAGSRDSIRQGLESWQDFKGTLAGTRFLHLGSAFHSSTTFSRLFRYTEPPTNPGPHDPMDSPKSPPLNIACISLQNINLSERYFISRP